MEVEALDIIQADTNITPTKPTPRRKRKDDANHQLSARKKKEMRIRLSLTRPSYVLRLCPKPLRTEHRRRLQYLLRRLVNQQDWVAASGVLSVYLKGTVNDASPNNNRFKFWVLLELIKHVKNYYMNPTRITNLYDIWSKKIGLMKTWPVESRYAVQLEFLLFRLMQGDANQTESQLSVCIEQEKTDNDPVSKMMMGLTFYELWYSGIPDEFKWRDLDQIDRQENSQTEGTSFSNRVHMEGISFSNRVGQSEWHNSVESHMADSQYQCDSDSSVMGDGQISGEIGTNKDMIVSMDVDANHRREKSHPIIEVGGFSLTSDENPTQDILHTDDLDLGKLDLWLLPLRFPEGNGLREFHILHRDQFNDYYNNAENYLRLALNSTSFASAALLPLIQLLLIRGRVNDVLTLLENQCNSSYSVLPIRLRAILLEHFDRKNTLLIQSCFEDILKKDPTCRYSLAKLIKFHQMGYYGLESLLEMIALHLDATDAEYNTWKELSVCFSKFSPLEDHTSTCSIQNVKGQGQQHHSFRHTPKIFIEGISAKSWNLRCRWWRTKYFSNSKFESNIKTGDLQLLTWKAACASYMYGQEFSYVVKAYSHLQKENDNDLLRFLDEHKRNSYGIYNKNRK